MPENRHRDPARSVANSARQPRTARTTTRRRSLPVVTPRLRKEPLVLTKRELGKRVAALFTALDADPKLRSRFIRDPMGVVAERVHEHRADEQTVSEANRFIVSMLADDRFMGWYRGYRKAHPDANENELIRAFTDALVEHGDQNLLVSLVKRASSRVGLPSNFPANTSSRGVRDRLIDPALVRAIAENLIEQAKKLGEAGTPAEPTTIIR